MNIMRYTWEDAMIIAQRDGHLSNGALLTALKLSKAMNWAPTERDRLNKPALYWKNDLAFEAVGLGRSTYYRHAKELRDVGFITTVGNNLHPRIPESPTETDESKVETEKSQVEIQESLGDQPCSEELLSEDSISEDECSEPPAEQGRKPGLPLTSRSRTQFSRSSSLDNVEW